MNMKMNFSMDEIRLKVEEYIKKGSRAAGRPVLTAYYVLTADSTPESERTNIMIALVAIVFPAAEGIVSPVLLQKPHPQSLPHREGSFEVTTAAHGLIELSCYFLSLN